VTRGIHDRFVDALIEKLKTVRVGNALDRTTTIGPVVDANQLEKDLAYLGIGAGEGATLAFGGDRPERATTGFYLTPILWIDTDATMRVTREEIFGPAAAVLKVDDYDEAIAMANDTDFGLCAGVCTTSLRHAVRFKRDAEAGMVMVNLPTAGVDYHVPFGGRKGSSYGSREQGAYAREFYTVVKTAYTATPER
jgi:aldehyde dehydrogenase (NAD+)